MAAYQTQQVNVGSIAAPDVGSVFANFVDRINRQQSNQLDNMRQAAQFDRQQVLNQRADQLWNRQQGVLQASKDIAKELIDTPYSAKFGGTEAMAKVDEDVRKEAQRRLDAGEAPFSAEEAAGIQKTYEANRPYKEDAIRNIVGRLMAQGATAQEANAEAEGLTKGLISRADEQSYLDQNRKVLQEQYDNVAKANLEALKANIDIGKSNQTSDYHKAQLQQQANQLLYGNSTGGGSGGGKNGVTAGGAGGISQILQGVGAFDAKDAQEQIKAYYDKGYTDQQIFNVIKNAVDTDPTAWLVNDNKIDFNAVDRMLSKQAPGMTPYTSTTNIRDVNTGGINAADLMAKIAPYKRAGYDPDRMEALLKANVPSIFKEEVASKQQKDVNESKEEGNFTSTTKKIESGTPEGNYSAINKTSGALGAYQFMPKTLNDFRTKHGNFTDEQFLKDPKLQDEVFKEFSDRNERVLKAQGIDVNDYTKWIAHNLGAGNVRDFVNGNETVGLKKAIASQFGGKNDSIEAYNNRFAKEFNGKGKDTKVETIEDRLQKFNALPEPEADKGIENLKAAYSKHGGGIFDYNRDILDLMKTNDIDRRSAEELYDDVIKGPIREQQQAQEAEANAKGIPLSETEAYKIYNSGLKNPKQLFESISTNNARKAEIQKLLGDHPAPTPNNLKLMDEYQQLLKADVPFEQYINGLTDDIVSRYIQLFGIGSGIPSK